MTSIFGDRGRTLVSSNQSTQTVFLVLYAWFLLVPTSATPQCKTAFYLWKKSANFQNIIVRILVQGLTSESICIRKIILQRQDMGLLSRFYAKPFKTGSNLFLSLVASWILILPCLWLRKVAFLFMKLVPSGLGNCKGLSLRRIPWRSRSKTLISMEVKGWTLQQWGLERYFRPGYPNVTQIELSSTGLGNSRCSLA